MANYGANYEAAYVTVPSTNMGTDSSAVVRRFVDTVASSTTATVAIDGVIPVGVKLRPSARIIACHIESDGNGGSSNCDIHLEVTDGTTTTVLTSALDVNAGSAVRSDMLPALALAGGVQLTGGEQTVQFKATTAAYSTAGGELSFTVDYLDI